MGKSAPSAPQMDYAAQGRLNREAFQSTIEGMNPTTYGPYGSVEFTGTPGEGDYTRNITLSPQQQAILDSQQGAGVERSQLGFDLATRLRDTMGQPLDYSGFQEYGDIGDYDTRRQSAEDAAYARATSRLDPRFQQGEEAMDVKLRSQGLQPGDQAYDNAMRNFNMSKEDAYAAARNEAVGQGRQESALAFGQEMGTAGYQNQLRQQQIAEELQKRGWGLNEVNALMSGQNIRMPTVAGQNAPAMQPVDVVGGEMARYQGDVNAFNAQQANLQGWGVGLAGAGALAFSDSRLKDDIKFTHSVDGVNFYTWKWNDKAEELGLEGEDSGVIAQELLKIHPTLVVKSNGYYMVDYSNLRTVQ